MIQISPFCRVPDRLLTGLGALTVSLVLAGFSGHATTQDTGVSATSETGTVDQSETTTPGPADSHLAAALVDPDPNVRHLAPKDTFFLLKYVSARTDNGVEGFPPGQEVRLVEVHRPTETLVVTNGHAQVEVAPVDLTNDRDVATMAREKDQAKQTRVADYIRAQQEAYRKYQQAAADYTAKDIERREEKQKEQLDEIQAAKEERRQERQSSAAPVNAAPNTTGAGYYDYGNEGYGSPFAYFAGAAAASANRPTATSPATAPRPALPNNVSAPAAPAAPGRPK